MIKKSNTTLEKIMSNDWTLDNGLEPRIEITASRNRHEVNDTDYFYTETIRSKDGLGDIAIAPRRLNKNSYVDALFEVHIENGKVKTVYKYFPDDLSKKWRDENFIDNGKRVAIAFDGNWKPKGEKWIFETKKLPYIFWIDNFNKLNVQLWNDDSTRIVLAENVEEISAIRGWKSVLVNDDDQGVIVSYIKKDETSGIFYRNFAEQKDSTKKWEAERFINTNFKPNNINMFLTNDYRTGFISVSSSGENFLFISSRNWAGMAIRADYIDINARFNIDFSKISKKVFKPIERTNIDSKIKYSLCYLHTDNIIVKAYNINANGNYGSVISCVTKNDIHNSSIKDWVLKTEDNKILKAINYVSKNDDREHLITFSDFNNVNGSLTLCYLGKNGENVNGDKYKNMEFTFTLKGLDVSKFTKPIFVAKHDRNIRITFNRDIEIEKEKLLKSLKITSLSYENSLKENLVNEKHHINDIALVGRTLDIEISSITPMRSAKTITVIYDSNVGGISGYNSFNESFNPEYKLMLDPAFIDNVNVRLSPGIKVAKINKIHLTINKDNISITAGLKFEFINIKKINP